MSGSCGFYNEFSPGVVSSPIVSCTYRKTNPILQINSLMKDHTPLNPDFVKLDFKLVGFGKKPDYCGSVYASDICRNPECGKVHYNYLHCKKPECPECYGIWIHDSVNNVEDRLYSEGAKEANPGKRLPHVILSKEKSEELTSKKGLNKMIHDGQDYAKLKNIQGGVMIPHMFRATSEAKYKAHQANKKTWEWIRAQPRPEDYQIYSPHLHTAAYIGYMPGPMELNNNHEINQGMQIVGTEEEKILFGCLKNDGTKRERRLEREWIYKTITDDYNSPVSYTDNREGLRGLIGYLLTHAAICENIQFKIIRWFGNCSERKFKTIKSERPALDQKPHYCKVCGCALQPFWDWIYENYFYVVHGEVPEPEYFQEIQENKWGEGPPKDAKKFLVCDPSGEEGKEGDRK